MRAAAILPRRASPRAPLWRDRISRGGVTPADLLAACDGNTLLAALLHARGVDAADVARLLGTVPDNPGDPFLFPGMDAAVACLREAAGRGERCIVFGDFDCDGLTGTTLLTEGLRALGLEATAMLPNRRRDGYGLSPHHVDQIVAAGSRLLVTVDCGSSSHAALERAAELGLTVIVTDHHPPHLPLPPALAILNPRLPDTAYPDHDLCGAGVAHALLRALALDGGSLDPDACLDLVALGTIADVVPLRGENRALVQRGLPVLARAARPGLKSLIEVSGVSRLTLAPRDISFGLAPRLNAAGRLGDAELSLALLQARRPRDARPLAAELDAINAQRQALTREATEAAIAQVDAGGAPPPMIVVWDEEWHPGIVGLVASRLVERYRCPAVALGRMDGRWRGSARSIEGFDVGQALTRCADLLVRQGGHPMAAGLEADDAKRLEPLRERLGQMALDILGLEARPPHLLIDLHLAADAVDWDLADALAALHPCGAGWPEPIVAVHGATVLDVQKDGGAMRLIIAGRGGVAISAPARSEVLPPYASGAGAVLDLAITPAVRDRRGYRCLELDVLDARPAGGMVTTLPPSMQLMV